MTKTQYLQAMKMYHRRADQENSDKFVAREDGKGLSSNDYTIEEKNKLNAILDGAEPNTINTILLDGNPLEVQQDKSVNIDLSVYAKKDDISTVYNYRGSVNMFTELPPDAKVGDVYNVMQPDQNNNVKAGDNLAWNGTEWDNLSGSVDLSGYVAKEEGKGLSSVDVTQEMADKWNSSAAVEDDITDQEIDQIFTDAHA